MDIFVEQIVKKSATGKDKAIKAIILIGVCLLTAMCLLLIMTPLAGIGVLFLAGVLYGGYYLLTGLDCEYEYIVTNGEIDIDKIIAKRKRKRLITAKAPTFEAFGEYTDDVPDAADSVTIVKATGENENDEDTKLYYADFKHASAGNVRLIFAPEERVVDAIVPFLPAAVRVKFRK